MLKAPRRQEIDHRTIKLIVGVVALTLASLTDLFASSPIPSISASYYEGGWSQSIFIGFLFAISAFLLAYNGLSRSEMVLSKVASVAGLGVALFPCECPKDGHKAIAMPGMMGVLGRIGKHVDELAPYVHGVSATTMFLVLTYFCYQFLRRAWRKGHPQAKARATIYALCGIAILSSIAVLGSNHLARNALTDRCPRLIFYGEGVALVAFGISWLTASRILPVLTRRDERFSPFRDSNPD